MHPHTLSFLKNYIIKTKIHSQTTWREALYNSTLGSYPYYDITKVANFGQEMPLNMSIR